MVRDVPGWWWFLRNRVLRGFVSRFVFLLLCSIMVIALYSFLISFALGFCFVFYCRMVKKADRRLCLFVLISTYC